MHAFMTVCILVAAFHVTMHSLGQCCWAAVLAATTGSLVVTFGVALSCRDTEGLEELIFPTMRTVAVRSVLNGTVSFWLRYMQENMSSISAHQHFPLREAQKLAKCNGPLFNTLFLQKRRPPHHRQEGSEPLMRSVGGEAAVEYPVCVEMELTEDTLLWRIACDGAYASQVKASHMLQELDQVLGYAIRSPEGQVVAFSGQEVSICGLSPMSLTASGNTATAGLDGLIGPEDGVWSPTEEIIRNVLSQVSGVPVVAIQKTHTIYHLGLDSISAIKAGSALRKQGIAIGFRDILRAGSISEMARLVRMVEESSATSPQTNHGICPVNGPTIPAGVNHSVILSNAGLDESRVEDILPASAMQVHMLSVWQNTKGQVFYPCFRYTLSGQVDISTIAAAWQALVAEIPILRTVFISTNSQSTPILQVVLHPTALDQTVASPKNNTWFSRAADDLSQPYNCLQAQKDGDRWILRLKIYHSLYDAVNLPAIIQRFAALCSSNNILAPDCQPSNWRGLLAANLSEDSRSERKQFWTEYLSGVEPSSTLCFPLPTRAGA